MQTITVIGVGLIGGSIAYAIKKHKPAYTVIGVDRQGANLTIAEQNKLIDVGFSEITAEALTADIVIIATEVAMIPTVLQTISQFELGKEIIITDVASTKRGVLQAFKMHLAQHYAYCVAGHPVAGCEKSGVANLIPNLFDGQKVILCPHESQREKSLTTVKKFWQLLQAEVHIMPADLHDQIFAMTSHLPHLLAYSFINQLNNDSLKEEYLCFAGSGFRDFTRIAASDPEMWAGISMENDDVLLGLLRQYKKQLEIIESLLLDKSKSALKSYFSQSQNTRHAWENSKSQL